MNQDISEEIRLKRWRLLLGGADNDGIGIALSTTDAIIDRAVSTLYDGALANDGMKKGTMAASAPTIARWLGDIRTYFPSPVIQVMQQDALERFDLKQLLFEPELLAATEPDIHLVATLLALKDLIPHKTRNTARQVVGKVVDQIQKKLAAEIRQSIIGAINRSQRAAHPRGDEIDWDKTIRANLKHYQPEQKTIIPDKLIGFARKRSSLREIIMCVDQSGSMATSIVYSGILAAVMASLPSVSTKLVAFDTSVVNLTEHLSDPIDLLFSFRLGGGTDINKALAYCQTLISRPTETVMILLSDLYEGGNRSEMLSRASSVAKSGVTFIALLALSNDGTPAYDRNVAENLSSLNIPAFGCTPDLFPDLIATAIAKNDVNLWAENNHLALSHQQTGSGNAS